MVNYLARGIAEYLCGLMERGRRERGMALLATMMALALMTIIVVDFTSASSMGYLSAANNANEIRSSYLARSAINVGLALIAQDTRAQMAQAQSGTAASGGSTGTASGGTTQQSASATTGQGQPVDSFASVWAIPFPPMPVNGGTIGLSVTDEARKFNINKLINTGPGPGGPGSPGATPSPLGQTGSVGANNGAGAAGNPTNIVGQPNVQAVAQFTNLVTILGLDPGIVPAIVDWLDTDGIEIQPGGAEADYYLRLTPPYAPRNGPMPTLGDLRLIKGIDDATFAKLRNYVTVAPEYLVNPNTASPEVLASLDPQLTPDLVKSIIDARSNRPFSVVTDVTNLPGLGAITNLPKYLTLRGQYFTITGVGNYAGARKLVFATFRRNPDGTGTLGSWQED
jgi:general secretion pathway protein K